MQETSFGRYQLRGMLGQGGMGNVYQAYDTATQRSVAIKVLPEHAAQDPEFRTRFEREARCAARIGEPHIVPIFDFGEIDGRLFLAMQLIQGTDVGSLLAQAGPIDPTSAVAIIEQIAAALDAAHADNLLHRDVTPSNILLTDHQYAYLIDFGIARAVGDTSLTATGATIGTFAYMAPERFKGEGDARVDVYALACVLHECLTATRPFPGSSVEEQLSCHLHATPPRPSRLRPTVPASFDDVIARGMAKDPLDRYPTAGQLAEAAREALHAASTVTRPAERPAEATNPRRIGVVEDHAVAVSGLRHILTNEPNLTIVAAAPTVAELLAVTAQLDLVVLDLRLPDGSSPIANVEQLRAAGIEALVLTSGDEPFLVRAAAQAGVLGVVRKSEREEVIAAAVREAARGRAVATMDWAAAIDSDEDLARVNLSPRQREVLSLYASGESAERVAKLTGLTVDTVNAYLGRIRQKYAEAGRPARTKTDLYKRALEDGWLPIPRLRRRRR